MALPHLFSPLKVGSITLLNRVMFTAHNTQFTSFDPEGYRRYSVFNERAMYYYADRAKGGFGLSITGQTYVHPISGIGRPSSYATEVVVPNYRKIADAVHAAGGKMMVQLNLDPKGDSGPDSWDPVFGATAAPATREMRKPLEIAELDAIIQGYIHSATNCRDAGMDGVELNFAHSHFFSAWLTPANKRADRYGGSLENRMRFHFEVINGIRKALGREFVVGVRMNGMWAGSQTVEDSVEIAKHFAAPGQIDFLSISAEPSLEGIGSPHGKFIPWAASIKQAVTSIPVFGVGRITDPRQAEEFVAKGQVDVVGLTRAGIADPELPNKAREGRFDDIRFCVGAGQGCLVRNASAQPLTCTQNPAVGMERDWGIGTIKPAVVKKHVVVIGGGPAGMEAAIVASQRGHKVTLLEKAPVLGGQVNFIVRVARHAEFADVIVWRQNQLQKRGVEVRLGTTATPALIQELKPDVVILATGSQQRPATAAYPPRAAWANVPGSELPHVFNSIDALEGKLKGKQHVMVVDAFGYNQSSDAAEFLVANGAKVSVITHAPGLFPGMDGGDRGGAVAAIRKSGGRFYVSTMVEKIRPNGIDITETLNADKRSIDDIDAVVLSLGADPVDTLYTELKGMVPELHRIGDCLAPRGIEHAVHEGQAVGRAL